MRAASPHKKLRIHTGSHVHPSNREGRRDQLRFLDYWLKGIENGVWTSPPVRLAIRKGRDEIEWRDETEWPLARTRWTKSISTCRSRRADKPNTGALVAANPAREPAHAPIRHRASARWLDLAARRR